MSFAFCLRAIAAALILCGSLATNSVYAETEQQVAAPQDQDAVYVTVFGDESDSHYRAIKAAVRGSGEIQQMLTGSHYSEVPSSSEMFRTRYQGSTQDLPCVRIQKADGTVILQTSGANAPHNAEELIKTMQRCPRGICPWNSSIKHRKPEQQAAPQQAAPEEAINFAAPPVADVQPDVEPVDEGPDATTIVVGVVASLAAAGLGAYVSYKKSS